MVRTLLRAPLHMHRITVLTPSVLYCRTRISRSTNPAIRRSYASHRSFERNEPKQPRERRVGMGKDKLTVELTHGPASMSYIRLRDLCQCPSCVDPYSKQRNFRTSDIPTDIKAKSLKWEDNLLWATWENDLPGFDSSHVSVYSLDQLDCPLPSIATTTVHPGRPRAHWMKQDLQVAQHWVTYRDYMHDDRQFTKAMRFFSLFGILFVKDIPDSREMVEKVANRIGPLRNTFYGQTWDVRQVPEAKNVAYTSQFLGFHMDLMYMTNPPAVQLLHCLRNSCDGGESLFVDSYKVAFEMFRSYPEEYKLLTKTRLRYHYDHEDQSYTTVRPVFEESRTPGVMRCLNYSPPFQAPGVELKGTESASVEHQRKEIRALKIFADLMEDEKFVFELKLNPGECVIFDNRRVLHARRQFNTASGERWLAGAYLDDDVVMSRFRTLHKTYPALWHNTDVSSFKDAFDYAKANPIVPAWSVGTVKEPQAAVEEGGYADSNHSTPEWAIHEQVERGNPSELDEEMAREHEEEDADARMHEDQEEVENTRWIFPSAPPKYKSAELDLDDPTFDTLNEGLAETQAVGNREQGTSSLSSSTVRPESGTVFKDALNSLINQAKPEDEDRRKANELRNKRLEKEEMALWQTKISTRRPENRDSPEVNGTRTSRRDATQRRGFLVEAGTQTRNDSGIQKLIKKPRWSRSSRTKT
ncbi:hypothetical protein BDV18DRAFT_126147 [Aspergillus unguis]